MYKKSKGQKEDLQNISDLHNIHIRLTQWQVDMINAVMDFQTPAHEVVIVANFFAKEQVPYFKSIPFSEGTCLKQFQMASHKNCVTQ